MSLSRIIGHGPLITLLKHSVARGSVPQALLLAGPEGVGKHAVALALAQAVNCPVRRKNGRERAIGAGASDDDACGACSTCLRIARGQHSDVTIVDRGDEASIKIKLLRERVLEVIGYRPFEAERRVFIIDADDLQDTGQDALLKTLEEPPSSAILILIAAYPDALSATVQSRCRRLRFGPLSERDVARVLVEHAGVDKKAASGLAAASGGSVTRALAEKSGDLSDDRDAAIAILAAMRKGVGEQLKASAAFAKNESDRRDREALGARLDVLGSLLRDVGAILSGSTDTLANADLESDLRAFAGQLTPDRVIAGYAALGRAQNALDRNASPKIVADWVALHL